MQRGRKSWEHGTCSATSGRRCPTSCLRPFICLSERGNIGVAQGYGMADVSMPARSGAAQRIILVGDLVPTQGYTDELVVVTGACVLWTVAS